MFGLLKTSVYTIAVISLLLISVQINPVESALAAYAVCEGACVTIFTGCLATLVPIPGAEQSCYNALTTCTDKCLRFL